MKIYYRGYVINKDNWWDAECVVQGARPDRMAVTVEDSPLAAMRWIDRDVIRQKVAEAGWLPLRSLPR